MESTSTGTAWQQTACILCSVNCGIEVAARRPAASPRVRGDRAHPGSRGLHLREGAAPRPLPERPRPAARRRCAGAPTARFEAIDWDTAIREIAARLVAHPRHPRRRRRSSTTAAAARGTTSAAPTRAPPARALGSIYTSNALAQEKTGEFWVDGQLFGRPRCHTTGDFEHAEVAVFVGKNPWQSHGFPRARAILREIAGDPEARADRHRSAPHRDRRARRLPPAGAARAPTPSA